MQSPVAGGREVTEWRGRPVWAEINLTALSANVSALRTRAGSAALWAVVKANAYGHGAVPVARAALSAGAAGLCVICVDEGLELRHAGLTAPILVLGYTPPGQAADAVAAGLTLAIHDEATLRALASSAARRGTPATIHLEVESGLNRQGLSADDTVVLAEQARTLGVTVEGLFTHFAVAEEGDKSFTLAQARVLHEVASRLPWVPRRHCAATASVLDTPELSMSMVRAGLGLYGYHPAPQCGLGVALTPVMTLKSRLGRVMRVPAGATVGYGRAWVARQPTTVGLVMCGYADGYPRRLSQKAHALVGGRRVPVLGRVAMDMFMVDVSSVPEATTGSEVVLLGQQGAERVDADDLAALADTISWDILAGISRRVPRVYLEQGEVVLATTLTRPFG